MKFKNPILSLTKSLKSLPLLLIAGFAFAVSCKSQNQYAEETLRKISEIEQNVYGGLLLNNERPPTLAERMAKYKVKGLSIAVIENYKIAWAKGYGWADEAEKRPVTPETLFEPGSISKSLNAIGILKLAQDKKVDLNADINTYLKSWKFPYDSVSNGKKITLAQILSHNAGLSVHGFPGHDRNGPVPTIQEVLDGKAPAVTEPVRSMMEPGTGFVYSGGGTTISQLILTDVTGQPYDKWMYDNVLQPIGMANSSFSQPPPKEKEPLCATGYLPDGSPIPNKFHVYPEYAAAGLWMTPSELCHYIIDMQLAYQGKRDSKVLNKKMVKLHLTPYNDGPSTLGSFIVNNDGYLYFEHSAGNDGFCGDFYASLEDGYGCVVFLNAEAHGLLPEIMNSVAKTYNWKNFYREPRRRTSIAVSDSLVDTYQGIYLYDQTWSAIGKKNGAYHFHTNNLDAKMYFSSPTAFFNEEFTADKEFIKDAKGNITGYSRKVGERVLADSRKVYHIDSLNLPVTTFHEISLYLLDNQKYAEAAAYLQRAVSLYPEDMELLLNLANMYLYNGEYEKAMAIYKFHLNDKVGPDSSWQDLMRFYVGFYKEQHYDVSIFDKVFKDLNISLQKN